MLVADELAANAIEHGSRANDEIEIRCSLEGRRLRIAVFDNARKHSIPVAYTPQGERARGHGLQLVERLADCWTETIVGGRRQVVAQFTLH